MTLRTLLEQLFVSVSGLCACTKCCKQNVAFIQRFTLCRVEQQRKQLAPQVTKWKAYEARASAFQGRKMDFLQQQADRLASTISTTQQKVLNVDCACICFHLVPLRAQCPNQRQQTEKCKRCDRNITNRLICFHHGSVLCFADNSTLKTLMHSVLSMMLLGPIQEPCATCEMCLCR